MVMDLTTEDLSGQELKNKLKEQHPQILKIPDKQTK